MSNPKILLTKSGKEIARQASDGETWLIDDAYVKTAEHKTVSAPSVSSEGGFGDILPISSIIIGIIFAIFAVIGLIVVVFWIFSLFAKHFQNYKIIQQTVEMVGLYINGKIR